MLWLLILLYMALNLPIGAGAQTAEPAAPEQKSMADVTKQLNNPATLPCR